MEFRELRVGSVNILELKGRLDIYDFDTLEAKVSALVETGTRKMILDFKDLTFISSAGLRIIIMLLKKLDNLGGELVFCGVHEDISKVFGITGYSNYFKIEKDRNAALKYLGE